MRRGKITSFADGRASGPCHFALPVVSTEGWWAKHHWPSGALQAPRCALGHEAGGEDDNDDKKEEEEEEEEEGEEERRNKLVPSHRPCSPELLQTLP